MSQSKSIEDLITTVIATVSEKPKIKDMLIEAQASKALQRDINGKIADIADDDREALQLKNKLYKLAREGVLFQNAAAPTLILVDTLAQILEILREKDGQMEIEAEKYIPKLLKQIPILKEEFKENSDGKTLGQLSGDAKKKQLRNLLGLNPQ